MNDHDVSGAPIGIGGVGGSGTRVVAAMLEDLGVYIGSDLNPPLDNRWFTLLFKRPAWYERAKRKGSPAVGVGIAIFEQAMQGTLRPSPRDVMFVMAAATSVALRGNNYKRSCRGLWPLRRAASLLVSSGKTGRVDRWGWKEPNTHVFLDELAQEIDNLCYVHVIRHGLDMAFSKNQDQLFNWGSMYGINPLDHSTPWPVNALRYWARANLVAIQRGRESLGERFFLLRFEALCEDPVATIGQLVEAVGLQASARTIDMLATRVRKPKTIGRFREEDLSPFTRDDFRNLERLGYSV